MAASQNMLTRADMSSHLHSRLIIRMEKKIIKKKRKETEQILEI
jgi:hypothetical protein